MYLNEIGFCDKRSATLLVCKEYIWLHVPDTDRLWKSYKHARTLFGNIRYVYMCEWMVIWIASAVQ